MQPTEALIMKSKPNPRNVDKDTFFENLPDLLRPETAASLLGLSVQTVYDWRYRPHQRNVPKTLFLKLNRFLYVRTSVLKEWISSQN
jgi:hypothetical protein